MEPAGSLLPTCPLVASLLSLELPAWQEGHSDSPQATGRPCPASWTLCPLTTNCPSCQALEATMCLQRGHLPAWLREVRIGEPWPGLRILTATPLASGPWLSHLPHVDELSFPQLGNRKDAFSLAGPLVREPPQL